MDQQKLHFGDDGSNWAAGELKRSRDDLLHRVREIRHLLEQEYFIHLSRCFDQVISSSSFLDLKVDRNAILLAGEMERLAHDVTAALLQASSFHDAVHDELAHIFRFYHNYGHMLPDAMTSEERVRLDNLDARVDAQRDAIFETVERVMDELDPIWENLPRSLVSSLRDLVRKYAPTK